MTVPEPSEPPEPPEPSEAPSEAPSGRRASGGRAHAGSPAGATSASTTAAHATRSGSRYRRLARIAFPRIARPWRKSAPGGAVSRQGPLVIVRSK